MVRTVLSSDKGQHILCHCADGLGRSIRWTPHPVIVIIRDNKGYVRALLYSYYTTITGWGVLQSDLGAREWRMLVADSTVSAHQAKFRLQAYIRCPRAGVPDSGGSLNLKPETPHWGNVSIIILGVILG